MRIRLCLMSYKAPSPVPSPCRGRRPRRPGGCRPQGRQERENVTGVRCGNDSERGEYANDFTVCWRSGSPSSVIRLAGDRRMPPSPAGGRKGRTSSGLVGVRGGLIVKSEKLWDRLRRSFENLSRSDTTIFHYSFLSLQLKMFRLGGADASGLSVRPKRPCPFPPRVGAGVLDGPEGVAHKGDRRGRT